MKNKYLSLFWTMFKIGLFTFGGGYAMIALLENEFVSKKRWIGAEEFLDMAAVAESTPGPIAINAATYIGYKLGGFGGALTATVAVCLPSFAIIYGISLFFDAFLALTPVAHAFKGIQAGVIYLIFSAGLKLLRSMEKTPFNLILLTAVALAMILCSVFSARFSTIACILLCGLAGILVHQGRCFRERKGESE